MRLNAQAFVREQLASALADAIVGVNVPNPRPGRFVLVRREGGGLAEDGYRDKPGIGVTCWAESESQACDLATRASAAMMALRYRNGVARVDEESLRSDPDQVDGSPRWYGSYTLTTYETGDR